MNGFTTFNISLNGLREIYADNIDTEYLNGIPSNIINYLSNVTSDIQQQINNVSADVWIKLITQPLDLPGNNTLISTTFLDDINMGTGANFNLNYNNINQNSGATPNQFGTSNFNNTTYFSNINQTNGSSVLKDTNIGVLTQGENKYITQQGNSTTSNNFRNTVISDLTITNSLVLPSNVTLPSSTYNGDIVMNNCRILQTDTSGTKQNQFINSDFISDVYVDGNLIMTNDNKNSTLKNPTLQGNTRVAGNITQVSGSNNFYDSTFSNIICNQDISCNTLHTSFISNAEFNTLDGINTSTTIQNQLNKCDASFNAINQAYISIGSVTTLSGGSNATASISGNLLNSVLNLGIPKGPTGFTGPIGIQGSTGPIGSQGIQGQTGPTGIRGFTGFTGSTGFTGLQGLQGIQGPQGNQGNQGAKGNKGDDGDKGDKGDRGSDGDATAATVAAGIASAAAIASAGSAAAAAVSAGAAAASAASAAASVAGIQTELNTIETRLTTVETDVDNLQVTTFGQSYTGGITQFSHTVEVANLNSDGNINSTGNVNIATGSSLNCNQINSVSNQINIGNLATAVYINGFLYDPLAQSTFFSQY